MRFFRLNDEVVQGIPRTKFIASDYQMHPLDENIHVDADDITISLPHSERFVADCTFTVHVNGHKGVKIDDTPINEGVDSVVIQFLILEGNFKMTFTVPVRQEGAIVRKSAQASTTMVADYNIQFNDLVRINGFKTGAGALPDSLSLDGLMVAPFEDNWSDGFIVNGDHLLAENDGEGGYKYELIERKNTRASTSVANNTLSLTNTHVFPFEVLTVDVVAETANASVGLPEPHPGSRSTVEVRCSKKVGSFTATITVPTGISLNGVVNGTREMLETENFTLMCTNTGWIIV